MSNPEEETPSILVNPSIPEPPFNIDDLRGKVLLHPHRHDILLVNGDLFLLWQDRATLNTLDPSFLQAWTIDDESCWVLKRVTYYDWNDVMDLLHDNLHSPTPPVSSRRSFQPDSITWSVDDFTEVVCIPITSENELAANPQATWDFLLDQERTWTIPNLRYWEDNGGFRVIVTQPIPGVSLEHAWPNMSPDQRTTILNEIADEADTAASWDQYYRFNESKNPFYGLNGGANPGESWAHTVDDRVISSQQHAANHGFNGDDDAKFCLNPLKMADIIVEENNHAKLFGFSNWYFSGYAPVGWANVLLSNAYPGRANNDPVEFRKGLISALGDAGHGVPDSPEWRDIIERQLGLENYQYRTAESEPA